MSDLDLPPDERTDAIARVLSAVGPQPGAGVDPDRLRDALAEEGRSLVDLPEVGLFLALIQGIDDAATASAAPADPTATTVGTDDAGHAPLTADADPGNLVIDLRERDSDLPLAALAAALLPPDATSRVADDESTLAVDPEPSDPARVPPVADAPPPDLDPGPLDADTPVPDSPAPLLDPPPVASTEAPTPERQRRQGRLAAFLRSALGDPAVRRAVMTELPTAAAPPPAPAPAPAPEDTAPETAPAPAPPALPAPAPVPPALAPDPEPDTQPEPAPSAGPEPATEPVPPATRPIDRPFPPIPAPTIRGLAPDVSGGARLDPWWPRHIVRDRLVGPLADLAQRPPRHAGEFERVAREGLAPHALVGAADLERLAPEAEAVLAGLGSASLAELALAVPATLVIATVDRAGRCGDVDDFDGLVGVRPIPSGADLDRALRTAFDRVLPLGLPDRGPTDVGAHERCFARLRFQAGLVPGETRSVVRAVVAASDAGAASGYEVARDWLLARSVVREEIHPVVYRLLTATTYGRRLLDGMLHLVRLRDLGALEARNEELRAAADLLGASPAAAAAALDASRTLRRIDAVPRRVQVVLSEEGLPSVRLPLGDARWLVNAELLAYGSPTTNRSAPLAPVRRGTWTITPGSSRRSPEHVGFRSRAVDRIVLAFDEQGRLVPGPLPLAGSLANLVVPAGEPVTGEMQRSRLGGRWADYERVTVALLGGQVVSCGRGRARTTIDVLADEASRVRGALGADRQDGRPVIRPPVLLSTRGPEPPAGDVSVVVRDDRAPTKPVDAPLRLADARWQWVRGAVRLDDLLGGPESGSGPRTVVIGRGNGIEDVHRVWWLADTADALWIDDPLAAARADDWVGGGARPGAADRWLAHTGWRPDPADAARAAARLVDELVAALGRPADGPAVDAADGDGARSDGGPAPLTAPGWRAAIAAESEALVPAIRGWQRAAAQWRRRDASIRNLTPLFGLGGDAGTDAVLSLVAAALTAGSEGRSAAAARGRLEAASHLGPGIVTSVELFALAYRRCQRDDPPSRFGDLPLTPLR